VHIVGFITRIPFQKDAYALNCLGRISFCVIFGFYGVQGQYYGIPRSNAIWTGR